MTQNKNAIPFYTIEGFEPSGTPGIGFKIYEPHNADYKAHFKADEPNAFEAARVEAFKALSLRPDWTRVTVTLRDDRERLIKNRTKIVLSHERGN